jgi:arsenite methyltransferase
MIPLFEHKQLLEFTGETIRPGGFVLTDRAVEYCRLPERSRVLDVGCGIGATVSRLRKKYHLESFGLDSSAGLLRESRRRGSRMPLAQAEASSLPVGDGRLAAVFCECVLSLTSDRRVVLGEFCRTLRPGGLLILTDLYVRSPEHASGLHTLPVRSCLSGAVARSVIEDEAAKSGFGLLLWEDHSALLKELAVRLIFAGCSLQSLFGGMCAGPDGSGDLPPVWKARPGYYLLIAEKGAR